MKANQISKEGNNVKLSLEFTQAEYDEALNKAYLANRSKFSVDGFRKGKAPRKIIENYYGADVFVDEALNKMLEENYYGAVDELGLEVISQPRFEEPQITKGEGVVLTADVQVFPEIEVKNYKGLVIEDIKTEIGEDEVAEELKKVQKNQARMETVERAAQNGDSVVLDFKGFVDGEEFQGGSAENFDLKLGSGQFIPGFEDQLVGKNAGEDVDVEVTFPEDYGQKDLAGKPAVFKCKLHEVKEEILPEIDDELASDVSEYETLAEYKEYLKNKLQKDADDRNESIMKDRALEELYKNNEIDTPEVMVENELDNMIYDMNQQLSYQGVKLDDYMKWLGKSYEDLRNESRNEAVKRINTRILLKNVIRLENLEVTDDEVEKEIAEFGKQYGQTVEDVKKMVGEENVKYFKEDAQTKKAINMIYENAKKEEVEVIVDKSDAE